MRKWIWIWLLVGIAGCAAAAAPGGSDTQATGLALDHRPFYDPQIEVVESDPAQFVVVLYRDMPTPGYRFEIDSLDVDENSGRIVAKITEVPPQGTVPHVITKNVLRLRLGSLRTGRYLLEIWTRRGADGSHYLASAVVLVATGWAP